CIHRAAMSGKGILFIEHDLAFVARVAQKVALLANGRVAFEGAASEVLDDARLRSAFLGEAPLTLAAGKP
ncbi:MAG TPA: hypothetical protein VFI87_00965, partial [Hyphomicrobiaceae bacterium]|nr:hypothetical protein [Hyphomicrobiaceae bacterium]